MIVIKYEFYRQVYFLLLQTFKHAEPNIFKVHFWPLSPTFLPGNCNAKKQDKLIRMRRQQSVHCKSFTQSESWLYLCTHVTPQCTLSDSQHCLLLAVLTHFALLWAMPTLCKGSNDKDFYQQNLYHSITQSLSQYFYRQ